MSRHDLNLDEADVIIDLFEQSGRSNGEMLGMLLELGHDLDTIGSAWSKVAKVAGRAPPTFSDLATELGMEL